MAKDKKFQQFIYVDVDACCAEEDLMHAGTPTQLMRSDTVQLVVGEYKLVRIVLLEDGVTVRDVPTPKPKPAKKPAKKRRK